jgi:phage terminase large subunit-like protein
MSNIITPPVNQVVSKPNQVSKEVIQKLYQLWLNDECSFVEDVLKSHLSTKTPKFHKEIYELLKESWVLLAAPRGFAKSYLSSFFHPLHEALFNKRDTILIISASEDIAVNWLRKIKNEMENNQLIRGCFGDMKSEKWAETHIILNNKIKTEIKAIGAGAQIRGRRPDLVILDDIETDETVSSEDSTKKLKEWIFRALIPTLKPNSQLVMIGTMINQRAIIKQFFEEKDNGWAKRLYKAYVGKEGAGNELWGDLWSHDKLQEIKSKIGTLAFYAEYMNDPILSGKMPITDAMIRYWETFPTQYSCVIAVDPAYSESDDADWKVAVCVAVDQKMDRYLHSYVRTHAPTGEYIDSILNLWLMNKNWCTAVGIPKSGGDREFFTSFMNKCKERNLYPPVVELKNVFHQTTFQRSVRNKHSRIVAALQPLFECGKYYIHKNHVEAREELLLIGHSNHDDVSDAMAYAEQLIQPVTFNAGEGLENNSCFNDRTHVNINRGSTGYGD